MNQPAADNSLPDQADVDALVRTVDRYIDEYLSQRSLPDNLRQAIRYAALGPGKRMRPILVLHSCRAVGGTMEQALAPAAAIEMVHAFSLVHDDLPAMDDDDLRRGRPTLHRYTNEAMAILAGDALMGLAFEVIVTRIDSPALCSAVIGELAASTNDMVAGQVYDTLGEFPGDMPPRDRLEMIHRHKTGALLLGSCRMGALCGGADDAKMQAIDRYGRAIGLMFQVVDDLLDVTQTTEHLGKTAGKDADQEKLTYPSVLGVPASHAEVDRLRAEAHRALDELGPASDPLRGLCDYLAVRTK